MSERYSDSARFRADLDEHITRGPHVDRDEDLSEMTVEIDAAEACEATLARLRALRASPAELSAFLARVERFIASPDEDANAPCAGCGLPCGAHTNIALARCEVLS